MWGGREGMECEAAKDVRLALDRYKEAVDLCCAFAREQGFAIRFALEPKPNEPRGDMFLPTVGHALAFIGELEWPDMVGLNPEFAHETMSGLNFTHAVAQTLWHGKLFHIDLNAQRIGKYDQDFRFGSEGIRDAFWLVKLLEDSGWDGMRHFDAHAYRTEDAAGVWDFAAGCMRTYLILAEKARRFADDADIAAALEVAQAGRLAEPTSPGGLGSEALAALRDSAGGVDEAALAAVGYGNERLDQLVTELLLGVR
jgi:xylose isomerase